MSLVLLLSCGSFSALAEGKEVIEVSFMLTMNPAEEKDLVQAELNRLIAEKGYNFEVNLVGIDFASWGTQMNLMLSDGSVDLFNCCWMPSLATLADNGSIAPLDDLLAQHGQGIVNLLGDYLSCATIDGQIYGTPKVDAFSTKLLAFLLKSAVDDSGVDLSTIHDFASLTEALKIMHEKHPDMITVANNNDGGYMVFNGADYLGTEDPLGVLMLGDEENPMTVVNYYTSQRFKDLLANAKNWSELGFFMKDPLNAQDGAFSYMANNQAMCVIGAYGSAAIGESVQGKTIAQGVYVAELEEDSWAATSNVTGMTWCIPSLSKHKEAAMQFLNLMYTDADIANLLCSGMKDKHYVLLDNGTIDFAEGLDPFITGWPANMGSFWPNMTITYPWTPDAPDTYQQWLDTNEHCRKSPALGFAFDASNVSDEVTACASVVDQYLASLMLNLADTDALYAEFISALEAAGIDDIIAEKQSQLDAWAANQ